VSACSWAALSPRKVREEDREQREIGDVGRRRERVRFKLQTGGRRCHHWIKIVRRIKFLATWTHVEAGFLPALKYRKYIVSGYLYFLVVHLVLILIVERNKALSLAILEYCNTIRTSSVHGSYIW
jgi:hypothetical protein